MANMQSFSSPNGVSGKEAGTAPLQNGDDTAFELPVSGAMFLLSKRGHMAAGYSSNEADELVRRIRLYSKRVREGLSGRVDFEVFEFDSLADLLSKVPGKNRKKKWREL